MRPLLFAFWLLLGLSARGETLAHEAEQHGDIDVNVALDPDEQTGRASATVRIHAPREVVWPLIVQCAEALKMVPGLSACEVLETGPNGSWQRLRQVLDYSWFVRGLTYDIRATYDRPSRVTIERISGDLKSLRVQWTLQSDGDYTVAHYTVELAPGFWVPRWLVRSALKHDLPKMLRALRTRAESIRGR